MRNWFMQASGITKGLLIGATVLVAIGLVAVPTALITAAATSQPQSTASAQKQGSSSSKSFVPASGSPSASGTPSNSETSSPENPKAESSQKAQAPSAPLVPAAPAAPAVTVPAAPTNFVLAGGGCDGVGCGREFSFTPPASDGGSSITGYQAGYSFDGGTTWQFVDALNEGNGSYIATLTGAPGIPTVGCVRAVNAIGAGPCSNVFRTVG